MTRILKIRNIAAKTFFFVLGLLLSAAAFYQDTLAAFWLTEKESPGINWPMAGVGFFLVFGASWYNTIVDALGTALQFIIGKFSNTPKK